MRRSGKTSGDVVRSTKHSALTIQICITIIEYEYPVHSIYALIPRPSYGKFDAVRSTTTYAIIPIIHAYTKYKV